MNFAHSLHRDRRHCAAGVARAALAYAALVLGLVSGTAGIPEPSLVWYGKVLTVTGGNTVRLTTGTLTWRIEPAGGGAPWTVSTTLTNINDQFSYVVQIPCESPEPGVNDAPGVVVLKSPPSGYGRVTVTLDGQPLNISSAPTTFSPTLTDRGQPERIDLT
ncbi:MAG TPA: hypothetical protein DCY13_10395, partial [Verrucomicrobiales bacterium]|nr:hypothetical protein [Verrucomicrobiales bacterium]